MHDVIVATTHHRLDDDTPPSDGNERRYRAMGLTGLIVLLLMTTNAVNPTDKNSSLRSSLFNTMDADDTNGATTTTAPVYVDGSGTISATSNSTDSRLRAVNIGMGCPEFEVAFDSATPGSATPFRSFTLTKGTGYAYVALHFSKLWMPRGVSVVLRAVEGFDTPDRTINLSTSYPSGQMYDDVLAQPLLTKEFRLEFYRNKGSPNTTEVDADLIADTFSVTDSDVTCFGFVIDSYDYILMDNDNPIVATDESICAFDNTKEAVCYYYDNATRTAFLAARSVARLLIPKGPGASAGCTAWLLGNQGHIMTNYHCVSTDDEASGTTVEFMAEANVCSDSVSCESWGACPGDTVAVSVDLIHADEELDYALLKLPSGGAQAAQTYGYLRLKTRDGVVGEQVYIPQHPLYEGKRIAMVDDYNNNVALLSLSASSCGTVGYSYTGDTQSGSSGSPVISFADHGVIALHHCGEMCANTGIPAKSIIADLTANGINVADFDGVDDGLDPAANAERFPAYTPPAPEAALPLTSRLTMNGAIILASSYVSIDSVKFTLASDTDISFDILSVEIADNDTFYDLNGDCQATYLDAMLYLFADGDSDPVFSIDDVQADDGYNDGSVSYRDPFMQTFLKKGSYTLAIAPTGASGDDALAGKTKADYPPELYTCRTHGSYGSYRLEISSTVGNNPLIFTSLPATVAINPALCHKTPEAICPS
ncbi:WRKY transcription factor 19 [Phytophthora cinnamomi]|uniref:WRKY transcription factor 19 n=1 Tax=Phytophthora cinnamomi TaxID=4785 RepID=UPI00355A3FC0|nr:WRKY transcription factor 19 [Phytophthora cinnamomi]